MVSNIPDSMSNPSTDGVYTMVIRIILPAILKKNKNLFDTEGIIVSFNNNFKASANGCNKPQ